MQSYYSGLLLLVMYSAANGSPDTSAIEALIIIMHVKQLLMKGCSEA